MHTVIADEPPPSPELLPLDQRVRSAVRHVVRESGPLDVEVSGTHVALRGRVRSFYAKQLAQTVAMSVEGVREVENAIAVESSPTGVPRT